MPIEGRTEFSSFRYLLWVYNYVLLGNKEVMNQIKGHDYAMDTRQVYLIGANFIEDKENRGLEYEIEALRF